MKNSLLFLLLLFWLNACNHTESASEFIDIEIAEAYTQNRTIELSKIIEDNIEYISLETKDDLILASPSRVYLFKSKIIVFAPRQIFLFDRVTGKFIREIGSYEKGPGGYMATLFSFPFDPVSQIVYAHGWRNSLVKYNLNGDYLGEVVLPEGSHEIGAINDTISVAFIRNFSGSEERRLTVFNSKNEIIKSFPNYNKCETSPRSVNFMAFMVGFIGLRKN